MKYDRQTRATRAPSGSPALSPSTGLNVPLTVLPSSLEIAIAAAASCSAMLILVLTIGAVTLRLSNLLNVFMWAAIFAPSLIVCVVGRARRPARRMIVVVAAILIAFCCWHPTHHMAQFNASPPSEVSAAFPQWITHTRVSQWAVLQPDSRILYGGEVDETIRFMEMECEPVPETAFPDGALSDAVKQWLLALEEQVRLIDALPFVRTGSVTFYESDKAANLNKVEATTWCCWSGGKAKRVMVACDESGEKPTHLEAAMALRLKLIAEHGQEGHPVHSSAAARKAALEAAGEVETAAPSAFDRITMARVAQQRSKAQVEAHEKAVTEAAAAERKAAEVREAAEAQLKASKAKAATLAAPTVSHKKQKTAFGAASVHGARARAHVHAHVRMHMHVHVRMHMHMCTCTCTCTCA